MNWRRCSCEVSIILSPLTTIWNVQAVVNKPSRYEIHENIQGMLKKDRTFARNTLFYNILSTVPFKVVPSTGDTPLPAFLTLLECFLERTFSDGAQFSYRRRTACACAQFSGCNSTTNVHSETG
jgi:hypothetical protein